VRVRRVKVYMNAPRKPVHQITDRAKRYRANSRENRPPGPKRCGYCGSRKNVGVDHVNGQESDGAPDNLMWACKSCNAKKTYVLRRAGLGRLTRQYNPGKARGSKRSQMQAYGNAIKVMRGVFEGDVAAAVRTIRETPADIRSAYTSRSWPVRRQFYGPSGRQGSLFGGGEVPF
jgi:HNH endonuclease